MSQYKRIKLTVSGRVQGVYYRASTKDKACALGLTGWVRNLTDGNVELEAQGHEGPLRDLESWVQKGPPHARVTDVKLESLPLAENESTFVICY